MTDYIPKKAHRDGGVNGGVPGRAAGRDLSGRRVCLAPLCEDETFCDECRKRIDGLAVFVTRTRPGYHRAFAEEVVGLFHPECFGYEGEVSW